MPLIRRRWIAAAGLVLAGTAAAVLFLPSQEQYSDRHRTRICAPPERVVAAIRQVLAERSDFALVTESPNELLFKMPEAVLNFTIARAPFGCQTVTTENRMRRQRGAWLRSALRCRIWLDAIRRRAEAK